MHMTVFRDAKLNLATKFKIKRKSKKKLKKSNARHTHNLSKKFLVTNMAINNWLQRGGSTHKIYGWVQC